jgi:two-component system, chemotaxis family, sensor kinase CheA
VLSSKQLCWWSVQTSALATWNRSSLESKSETESVPFMDTQSSLRETFLAEVEELLSEFEQGLVSLESTPDDVECIHRVFRSMHTLKSSAGMFRIEPVVAIAHAAEGVLDLVRSRQFSLDSELVSSLLAAADIFRDAIDQYAAGKPVAFQASHRALIELLKRHAGGRLPDSLEKQGATTKPHVISGPKVYRIQMSLPSNLFETGQDPGLLLLELARLGTLREIIADTRAIPRFEDFQPSKCYLSWTVTLETLESRQSIDDVFIFVNVPDQISISDITASVGSVNAIADKRIGELLVDEGRVAPKDVEVALQKQKHLGQMLVEMGKLTDKDLSDALAKQSTARRTRKNGSIRVDTDKLDRLINLVGELVIAVARVNQTGRDTKTSRSVHLGAIEGLDQIGRDLQTHVMSIRMVAIDETFNRFKRVVRDTSQELGKHAVLETVGNETELDKNVIEQLADPLKHMVRNSIAHGIESPEDRIRVGKSDTGRVTLSAAQRQGHVVIEVSDDGRGIDPARVLEKARKRGLVAPNATLTQRQILSLVFEPGFSTAEEVNEVSGRGVGLDVVLRSVKNLRGSIDIESEVGHGTTFRISLPLTLAIIDGMNVLVGQETLSIPLQSVIELIAPRAEQILSVEGRGELVEVRGEFLPVVRLHEVLDTSVDASFGVDTTVVVVGNNRRKFGILVDRVLGMEQAVVKPLKKAFSVVKSLDQSFDRPDGIAGATILGDGHVALILDVPGIEQMAFGALQ